MDYSFLFTFGLFIITFCLITGLMMFGYVINSLLYPSLKSFSNCEVFNKLSFKQKFDIISNLPKSALWNIVFIKFMSCIIPCAVFSYFAPNAEENEFCFLFQIIIIILYFIGEFYDQQSVPHPKWYDKLCLGYVPWMLSNCVLYIYPYLFIFVILTLGLVLLLVILLD